MPARGDDKVFAQLTTYPGNMHVEQVGKAFVFFIKQSCAKDKVTFFRRKITDFSARAARFFRKFWRFSGAKGRDLSLGFSSSEKTEGTLPEELSTELKRFRSLERRQSDRMTLFLRFLKIISSSIERAIAPASQS